MLDDEVGAVARGDCSARDDERVGTAGSRDEDTTAADGQATSGIEGVIERRRRVKAEGVDRRRRATDGGHRRTVDVSRRAAREEVGVDRVRDDVTAAERGPAGAQVRRGPATEEAAHIQTSHRGGGREARAVIGDSEVDRAAGLAGDRAEREGRTEGGRGRALGRDGTARSDRRAGEGLRMRTRLGALRGLRERAAAEDEDAAGVDDRRRGRRQQVVIQRQRAAEDFRGAGVIRGVADRQVAGADLAQAGDASRTDRAHAAVEGAGERRGAGAGDGEGEVVEVDDGRAGAGRRRIGRVQAGNCRRHRQLDGGARVEAEILTGSGAVRKIAALTVAGVERIGVVQDEGATVDDRVAQVGVDAAELQEARAVLLEGGRLIEAVAVETDTAREVDRSGRAGADAVGVEVVGAGTDVDVAQVRRRAQVGVPDEGRAVQLDRRVTVEVDEAVAEDRIRRGRVQHRHVDAGVVRRRADGDTAREGVRTGQDDRTVTAVSGTTGDDDGGIAGDGGRIGQAGAAAAEAVGRLAIDGIRGISTGVSQVLVGAQRKGRGVQTAVIDVLGRIGSAQRDRAQGAIGDLVDHVGLDAGEADDDTSGAGNPDARRGAEVRERVEAVSTRTAEDRAGPTGVIARHVDGAVGVTGDIEERVVTRERRADGSKGTEGAHRGVAHQVEGARDLSAVR